jgi:hypothetical protein
MQIFQHRQLDRIVDRQVSVPTCRDRRRPGSQDAAKQFPQDWRRAESGACQETEHKTYARHAAACDARSGTLLFPGASQMLLVRTGVRPLGSGQ